MTMDCHRPLSRGAGVLKTTSTVSGAEVAIRGVSVRPSAAAVGRPRSIRNRPPPTKVMAITREAQTSWARRETPWWRADAENVLDLRAIGDSSQSGEPGGGT